MKKVIHYTEKKGNTQHELNHLARGIFQYGKIESVTNHCKTTIHPNGDRLDFETGGKCFKIKSDVIPVRYWIHLNGFKITEIIEETIY